MPCKCIQRKGFATWPTWLLALAYFFRLGSLDLGLAGETYLLKSLE